MRAAEYAEFGVAEGPASVDCHAAERARAETVTPEDTQAVEQAFERLLAESSTLAFRIAYSVLRRREDAEDVAQDALARAHRKLRSVRDADRLRPWLVRLCWRMALDHRRSALRRERREQAAPDARPSSSVEDLAAENQFRERLFKAIDALPEKQRIVVMLAGIEGHGIRDVAALLDLPEGTIKSRLHVARQRLKEALR